MVVPPAARVAVRDEHVGQPRVAEQKADEAARRRLGCGSLRVGGAAGEKVDVHLQIMTRTSHRLFEEVDYSRKSRLMQPPRRDGTERRPAGGR